MRPYLAAASPGRGISPRCPGVGSPLVEGYVGALQPRTPRRCVPTWPLPAQVGASLRDARGGWRGILLARCYPSTPDASEMRPYLAAASAGRGISPRCPRGLARNFISALLPVYPGCLGDASLPGGRNPIANKIVSACGASGLTSPSERTIHRFGHSSGAGKISGTRPGFVSM